MNATAEPAQTQAIPTAPAKETLPHTRTHGAHGKAPVQRSRARPIIIGLVVAAILGWGAHFAFRAYHYQETDDAYIAGHLHTVSAQIDGQVKDVRVEDNQFVHAGDVLLELDPLQFQIALDKAKAAVAQTQAQVEQLTAATHQAAATVAEAHARVTQAEAQAAQATAQLELANITLTRNEQLVKEDGAAQAELDQARSGAQVAKATRNAASANLLAAQAAVKSAEAAQASIQAQIDAAQAAVAAAQAAQHDAERQLANTIVKAPSDGRVGNRHIESGDRVQAGQALLALAETDTWITANFKETQLAHMRVGQPVDLTIDAIPAGELHGRLESVSPASGAQFALLPPDNATGNFNKVVQRVPVKILLDDASRKTIGERIRLGLSVVVNVRVR